MKIELQSASEADFPVVQNLVRFYIYDMSEIMGWACPESGLFGGCDDLPEYWWTGSTPEELQAISNRLNIVIPFNVHFERWSGNCQGHPFMIRVDGELAGFALIKQCDNGGTIVFDVGEFFVVRKFRGKGVGKTVAHMLFDMFSGNWQVRQMMAHKPAQAFWRKTISDYTDGHYQETTQHIKEYDIDMLVQSLRSNS